MYNNLTIFTTIVIILFIPLICNLILSKISYKTNSETSSKLNTKNQNQFLIQQIDYMSPREFEILIYKLYKKMGYSGTIITSQTNDYGADILAIKQTEGKYEKIAIEVKYYSNTNKVGNDVVRSIVGGQKYYRADSATVITTSTFTAPAIKQAQRCNVELIDRKGLEDLLIKYMT